MSFTVEKFSLKEYLKKCSDPLIAISNVLEGYVPNCEIDDDPVHVALNYLAELVECQEISSNNPDVMQIVEKANNMGRLSLKRLRYFTTPGYTINLYLKIIMNLRQEIPQLLDTQNPIDGNHRFCKFLRDYNTLFNDNTPHDILNMTLKNLISREFIRLCRKGYICHICIYSDEITRFPPTALLNQNNIAYYIMSGKKEFIHVIDLAKNISSDSLIKKNPESHIKEFQDLIRHCRALSKKYNLQSFHEGCSYKSWLKDQLYEFTGIQPPLNVSYNTRMAKIETYNQLADEINQFPCIDCNLHQLKLIRHKYPTALPKNIQLMIAQYAIYCETTDIKTKDFARQDLQPAGSDGWMRGKGEFEIDT